MKVTKREEEDFADLDAEDQLAVIKGELFEFALRVVIALGIALGGILYGSNTKPNTEPIVIDGEVYQSTLTTSEIVLFTVGILAVSVWVGYCAYKRRERILNAVREIQGDEARDSL